MSLLDPLYKICSSLSFLIRLILLRVSHFVSQTIEYRTRPNRASNLQRTILLIGDGTAEGVGDSLVSGGLSARLRALIQDNLLESSLRLKWHVVTAGRVYSTSANWLPVPPSGTPSLFPAVTTGLFKDADVVVVLFGMHDDMHQSDLVVKNVANITEAVSRLGKHAVVPSFTNYHAPSSHMFTRVQEANTALQIALKDVVAKCNTPECGSICMALDSSKVTVLGGDVVNLENNFVTFNSSGYRIFASELYDYVLGAAKRVEWAYWKQRLQAPK